VQMTEMYPAYHLSRQHNGLWSGICLPDFENHTDRKFAQYSTRRVLEFSPFLLSCELDTACLLCVKVSRIRCQALEVLSCFARSRSSYGKYSMMIPLNCGILVSYLSG
jgi:hypothetical protein